MVIPAFNRTDPLRRAIESVTTAHPSTVEIVVVDDGSQVDLRTFLPHRNSHGVEVRVFRSDRNRGAQAARNLGIRRARFPLVAFLDSDDEFLGRKVDAALEAFTADPIDLWFHAVAGMDKYNVLARIWSRHLATVIPFHWLLAIYNPAVTPSVVIRRRCKLGMARLRHCEDWSFLLRYCTPGTRVRYSEQVLAVVHRRAGSVGGLSGNVWRMRRGEFVARCSLLKERTASAFVRFSLGTLAGVSRVVADLVRGRYFLS